MKASELISFLKDMISNYGDLELINEIEDIFVKNESTYGTVNSVSFDCGKILISGKTANITDWISDWNSHIGIHKADHYSVFRNIESPKESTGYSNYDGREF